MLIKLINANTTLSMTTTIEESARAVVSPGTVVEAVSPQTGTASIESHYDEALSVPGILDEIRKGEAAGVDGYVIACFGDPGLDAAREVARGPVLGIAEAAMHTASFLARRFSVVTTIDRSRPRAWDLADRYGMRQFCGGVHSCEIRPHELDTNPDARKIITEICLDAIQSDESEAIVIGCAGMADLCAHISAEVGVPVIDGVAAATLLVQSLVSQGLRKSGRGEFAPPPPKPYSGLLREFGG